MITPEDFEAIADLHYVGGDSFNGYEFQGYIGHSSRNYVTDAWVIHGANALGWTLVELGEWIISKWGRFALESDVMSADAMRTEMAQADLEELIQEALA